MNVVILFDNWLREKEKHWITLDFCIDKKYDPPYAVQRHIEISSSYAYGKVSYYESNDFYWVDFEAVSLLDEAPYFDMNIPFSTGNSLDKSSLEFERYMQGL